MERNDDIRINRKLFVIIIPIVVSVFVCLLMRGIFIPSLIFILTVHLILIFTYSQAKKGKILGLDKDPCQKYPFFKILLLSFLFAFIYSIVVWYLYVFVDMVGVYTGLKLLLQALSFTYWYGFWALLTFIILKIFLFITLTVCWKIAKQQEYGV